MIELIAATVLALVQGVTEYLPISSSAHLILVPRLLGWTDQGLSFDVAVHVGTLFASIFYFRASLIVIIRDWGKSVIGKGATDSARTGWHLIIASIPVGIAGALAHEVVETSLRSIIVIASTTLLFALLLWAADAWRRGPRSIEALRMKDALWIGLAQAIAIVPGTSRSGVAMTACLLLGMSRREAARFSFLLAIPAIAMAGTWQSINLMASGQQIEWMRFALAAAVSAAAAWLVIHWLLQFIERIGLLPFVIYRITLAALLYAVVLWN